MASKSARKRRKRRPPPAPKPAAEAAAGPAAPTAQPRTRRRSEGPEPPPAPWGSFPLIELAVLLGIVMLITGFFFVEGSRGAILIATGLLLGSIGGLELTIREHFAGYRSHTMLLAGVPALVVLGFLFYAGPDSLPPVARAGIGIAVFAIAAYLLSSRFAARSGGLRFKVGPPRSDRKR
jgi:hypothetical protein